MRLRRTLPPENTSFVKIQNVAAQLRPVVSMHAHIQHASCLVLSILALTAGARTYTACLHVESALSHAQLQPSNATLGKNSTELERIPVSLHSSSLCATPDIGHFAIPEPRYI